MKGQENGFWRMIWNVLAPFLAYYAVFMGSFFLLSYFLQLAGFYRDTITSIVNAIAMLIGAAFLLPVLREELQRHQVSCGDQAYNGSRAADNRRRGRLRGQFLLLTFALAVSSSVGLNVLLSLTGLVQRSAEYQEVAQRQYGVAFGIGLFLYTVVSPLAEEIVFRGVIYNRLRRYCREWQAAWATGRQARETDRRGLTAAKKDERRGLDAATIAAIVVSGILFGIYHGNLVQAVYGGCLGSMMAYLYERAHRFYVPCLFHAAANCVVYLLAQNEAVQAKIFTAPCCALLLGTAFLMIVLIEKKDLYNEIPG